MKYSSYSHFYKNLFIITTIMFFIVSPNTLIAQNSKNNLKKQSIPIWALQFQIENNFTLSSFQGSTISIMRYLNTYKAIRFGLSIGGNLDNEERENISTNREQDSYNFNFGVNSQYLFYSKPFKKVSNYFGLGPMFNYSYSYSKYDDNRFISPQQLKGKRKSIIWSVGLAGVLGVEWFVTNNISFLAEYSSILCFSSTYHENKSGQTHENNEFYTSSNEKIENKNIRISSGSVKFGLSIHF
ncbi:MAG: outer membrane beta-barrel protein [Candidatus Hodarchaeota archaeon]